MNKNIDEILNGLQGQQPTLYNEDELTDMIMDNLPYIQLDPINEKEAPKATNTEILEQATVKPHQAPPRIISIVRAVSSIAALWLVGFFAYSYADVPETMKENAVAISKIQNSINKPSHSGTLNVAYTNYCEKKSSSIYQKIKEFRKTNI